MPLYNLMIKSHCKTPDFEIEVEAKNREEALDKLENSTTEVLGIFTREEISNRLLKVSNEREWVPQDCSWLRQTLSYYDRGLLTCIEVIRRIRKRVIGCAKKEDAK